MKRQLDYSAGGQPATAIYAVPENLDMASQAELLAPEYSGHIKGEHRVTTGLTKQTSATTGDTDATKVNAPGSHSGPTSGRIAVLVVAMHRSGTSALSRILNIVGCDISNNLMPDNEWNEKGYWESAKISELNEKILRCGGSEWDNWQQFNQNWFRSPAVEAYREQAVACIDAEFGNSNLFVMKDPRFCILMPFWRDVLNSMGIEPVVIHTLRHPLDVAHSLQRRDGFLISKGVLLWLRYMLEGERGTRGLRRFFTTHDAIMTNPADFIEKSQDALKVYWPRNSEKVQREITRFLSDDLIHHKNDKDSLNKINYSQDWVKNTYRVLKEFSENGESGTVCSTLDAIYSDFNIAGSGLGSLILDNDIRFLQNAKLTKELSDAKAAISKLESDVESTNNILSQTLERLNRVISNIENQ
ncbi:sulfotransferase family protein [Sphingomonas sp. KC8]|uniref:sulfotransferase family protein n=1 Tax=Sphingomonas sp. KC8 TaxID=1030157 RepID=UPI000A31B45C|nr:hypothetical protein [Sphingomonas sp. KC8]ARS28388.1 hypothetical protein KC8_13975 [Sphingomonas sp. KC8]